MPSEYQDLHQFLGGYRLGEYADSFFEKGVRVSNFDRLTTSELKAMRLTNSRLIKKILQLAAKRENVRFARQLRESAKGSKKSDKGSDTHPAAHNGEAAAVNNATTPSYKADNSERHSPEKTAVTTLASTNANTSPRSRQMVEPAADGSTFEPTHFLPFNSRTVTDPTCNQCVRNATVYIPPTPAKRQAIVDGYHEARYSTLHGAAGGHSAEDAAHDHGSQAVNCAVCSELNVATQAVEQQVRVVRQKSCPFPTPPAQVPQYPEPTYNYALEFRLIQLSIDAHELQQKVWDEEERARDELLEECEAIQEQQFARERADFASEEMIMREAIMVEQSEAWKGALHAAVRCNSGLALSSREQSYRELLGKQQVCLVHVEAYERQCIVADEDTFALRLLEIGTHLYGLSLRDQRQRHAECDALDYRTRCPLCWKRRCTFFQQPWRLWSTKHSVPKENARDSDQVSSGIDRKGSFFRDHVNPTTRQIKALTGRCHGMSVVSEYGRLEHHSGRIHPAHKRKVLRSLPSTLRTALNGSSDYAASSKLGATASSAPDLSPDLRPQSLPFDS